MNKFKKVILLSALMLCITGCDDNDSKFSGSKTGNDHQFLVAFDVLNSTVSGNMPLSEGDAVETAADIEKGDVDIIVKNENGTIAYRGNDVKSCNFTIRIEETGTYAFSVTGSKAKGSVCFIKSSNR